MGFVLDGLEKSEYDREYGDLVLLRRILSYFKPYRISLLIIGITIMLASIAGTLVPVLMKEVLDSLSFGVNQSQIILLLSMVVGFGVLNFILNAVQQIITAKVVQSSVVDLREETFSALLRRDMSFFDEQPAGRLASRVTNDTRDYGQVISLSANLMGQVMIVVVIFIYLVDISAKLSLLVALFAPIVVLTALSFRTIARLVASQSQRILAKVNALIQESTSGIYIAKSFRAEQVIFEEFDKMNTQSYKVNLRRGIVFSGIFPILFALIGIGTAMVIYVGGLDILATDSVLIQWVSAIPGKKLTVGEWYLFLQGLNYFFFPLVSIASFWSQFQQGLAASERVFSLIDAENSVVQNGSESIDIKGDIEFDDITFSYDDGTEVLKNFNLHIKDGERIAIVGHTGAGKSTLVKLISRYYEFQEGMLRIDNRDIRSFDLDKYRRQLSIISQDVFLFNGSIKENLLYGTEHVEEVENKLVEILKQVEAMDWIERLENGLDTNVGERGSRLSFGQRQLIAFSRILLRDPAILIMDESTSSIDPLTEVRIQKATSLLLENRTSIVIAHRLSTVKHMDRIIVMKEGEIIEEGSHNQLLKQKGHYSELYDTYFRHQSLEYVESFAE